MSRHRLGRYEIIGQHPTETVCKPQDLTPFGPRVLLDTRKGSIDGYRLADRRRIHVSLWFSHLPGPIKRILGPPSAATAWEQREIPMIFPSLSAGSSLSAIWSAKRSPTNQI